MGFYQQMYKVRNWLDIKIYVLSFNTYVVFSLESTSLAVSIQITGDRMAQNTVFYAHIHT